MSDREELKWVSVKEFSQITGMDLETIHKMITRKEINFKEVDGVIYIDTEQGSKLIVPEAIKAITTTGENGESVNIGFVEKTISTILNLHEKVVASKDETISVLKEENMFLKEALISVQEILEDERNNLRVLTEQLDNCQEELKFVKKKYKLMWGKVIENYKPRNKF
ncbi:MAG TPA: DUF3972 domain-containing protein [Campylobacterales bacterium]|nr:DUF3972 domain-containing protein [Campylobacterales bacterium]HIO70731.1 DUF3972 domain-containing protein [Campylobacterales bacterium]